MEEEVFNSGISRSFLTQKTLLSPINLQSLSLKEHSAMERYFPVKTIPRKYQLALLKHAQEGNVIAVLQTGAGKVEIH